MVILLSPTLIRHHCQSDLPLGPVVGRRTNQRYLESRSEAPPLGAMQIESIMQHSRKERTNIPRSQPRRLGTRKAATSVEFAIVAIPLFLFVLSSIELGRGMMVVQAMEEAARSGCRIATLKGQTATDAEAEIQRLMSIAGISSYTTQVVPSDVESAAQWSPVVVRISASLAGITWVPIPKYLGQKIFTAGCVLPREAEPE